MIPEPSPDDAAIDLGHDYADAQKHHGLYWTSQHVAALIRRCHAAECRVVHLEAVVADAVRGLSKVSAHIDDIAARAAFGPPSKEKE